jgi:hypothetical protein
MTTRFNVKNYNPVSFFVLSPFSNRALSLLRQTLLTSVLIGLIWLSESSLSPAFAMPDAAISEKTISRVIDSASAESARMNALITCLPKQLSQADFKRAWNEMGDDQLQRAFNLTANPKLSQAEIELKSCMNRQRSKIETDS